MIDEFQASNETMQQALYDHDGYKASAVYPLAALLNHSCQPNLFLTFDENAVMECRTIKDIIPGEEISNCYGPRVGKMTTKQRQVRLIY